MHKSLLAGMTIVFLYGEGRPRLDLEYPVYGANELADEGAFTSVVVLTASFPSGFRRTTYCRLFIAEFYLVVHIFCRISFGRNIYLEIAF